MLYQSHRGDLYHAPENTMPAFVKAIEGKIFASLSASCPPAVPIVVCGEEIDKNIIDLFLYYGITKCEVVKE